MWGPAGSPPEVDFVTLRYCVHLVERHKDRVLPSPVTHRRGLGLVVGGGVLCQESDRGHGDQPFYGHVSRTVAVAPVAGPPAPHTSSWPPDLLVSCPPDLLASCLPDLLA